MAFPFNEVSPFPHPCSPCTARSCQSSSGSAGQAVQSQRSQPALFPKPLSQRPLSCKHHVGLGSQRSCLSYSPSLLLFQGRAGSWGDMQNIQGVTAAPIWLHLQGNISTCPGARAVAQQGQTRVTEGLAQHCDISNNGTCPSSCQGALVLQDHTLHPHPGRRGNTCWKCWNF